MSDQQQPEQTDERAGMTPSPSSPSLSEPLSELEALKAHEEALHRRQQTMAGEIISGAHGRVEEETRRLSEQMTREEQERRRALALAKTAPLIPAPTPARLLPTPLRIHTTLVALDGTPFAERALPYAAAFAHLTGSALTLGACSRRSSGEGQPAETIEKVTSAQGAPGGVGAPKAELLAARDRLVADGLSALANIVYASDIAEGLLLLERESGAEALALATHARAGIERAVLGSVADEVVRRGRGPTLVIPPLAPETEVGQVAFARALVPLDGSALSEEALRIIQPMLQRDPAGADMQRWLLSLTLFFVAEDQAQVRDAEVYLHDLREALLHEATAPTEITTQVLLGSAPGAVVARAAGATGTAGARAMPTRDERHDLIIMATHGRGGPGRWFYGSVATYVLAHSDVPVLLVRATP